MQCVGYVRVSTEDQKKEKCSIPAQISKIKSVIAEQHFTLLEIFKDDGISGSKLNRPGLQEMIEFCRQNKVDAIYVLDTDRLARDEAVHFALKAMFKKFGTRVESINQPMLNDSPEGKFLDSILAAVNALYPKITGRKTSLSMLEKIKLGWWPGPARIGYKNVIDEKASEGFEKNILIVDDEQAPLVEKSFKLFSTGKYTVEQLCNCMYKEGLRARPTEKAREDRKVVKSAMINILRNKFYTGKMDYMDVEYQGKHPRIIDDDTFILCNEILDQHNDFADRKRKHHFLLSDHIFCGICGRPYTAEHHGEREKSYYHCPAPTSVHSNKNQNIDTETLELAISNLFKKLALPPSLIKKVLFHAKQYLSENHDHVDIARKNLVKQQEKLENRRNNLETDLADRVIDSEIYLRQMETIKPELENIKSNLAKCNVKRENNSDIFEQLIYLSEGVHRAYCKASPKRKRAYLDLFWDKIVVEDKKIKKAVPTEVFQVLLSSQNESNFSGKSIKKLLWLPGSDSNGQHLR